MSPPQSGLSVAHDIERAASRGRAARSRTEVVKDIIVSAHIANQFKIRPEPQRRARQALVARTVDGSTFDWGALLEAGYEHAVATTPMFELYSNLEFETDAARRKALTGQLRAYLQSEDWEERHLSHLMLAQLAVSDTDLDKALQHGADAFKQVPINPSDPLVIDALYDTRNLLYVAHLLNGDIEATVRMASEMVEQSRPTTRIIDAFTVTNNLAFLFLRNRNFPQALEVILAAHPYLHMATPSERRLYHFAKGRTHSALEQYELAVADLERAVDGNDNTATQPYFLAQLVFAKSHVGTLDEISVMLEEIDRLAPEQANQKEMTRSLLRLRSRHAELRGDYPEAMRLLKEWTESQLTEERARASALRVKNSNAVHASEAVTSARLQEAIARETLKDALIARGRTRMTASVSLLTLSTLMVLGLAFMLRRERRLRALIEQERNTAVEASQAKTAFLATLNHEMRTPLNAIIPLASILENTETDSDKAGMLQTIRLSGEGLLTMIENSVLVADGVNSYQPDERDYDLVGRLLDLLQPHIDAAAAKGLSFRVDVSPQIPPMVTIDVSGFVTVLNNLTSNAVKFTEEGTIFIRLNKTDKDGSQLRLSISDTGIGMDSDRFDALCEPFAMTDNSTTRSHQGAGLGLCVSRIVVEHNGGTLRHTPHESGGSVVTATFPLHASAEEKEASPQSQAA